MEKGHKSHIAPIRKLSLHSKGHLCKPSQDFINKDITVPQLAMSQIPDEDNEKQGTLPKVGPPWIISIVEHVL